MYKLQPDNMFKLMIKQKWRHIKGLNILLKCIPDNGYS